MYEKQDMIKQISSAQTKKNKTKQAQKIDRELYIYNITIFLFIALVDKET